MLFLRSLWKNKAYFIAATALLLLMVKPWEEHWIMTAPGRNGDIFSSTEFIIPFVALIPVSFLLYNNYETELALINGVSTAKLMFCKFFACIVATILPLMLVILPLREKYYYELPKRITIPIHVPENYKLYLLFSAFVTVLFFASMFLLIRVALRNCYVPVGLALLVFSLFNTRHMAIHSLSVPFKNALFDPFITRYLMGDTVANAGFTYIDSAEVVHTIAPFPHLWTYNRLMFLGIALLFIGISYILLRREKLHESFGD